MEQLDYVRDLFLMKKASQLLRPGPDDTLLLVGLGSDAVLDFVDESIGACHCLEPDPRRARRLMEEHRRRKNVEVRWAPLNNLPYPHSFFTKIIFHNVSLMVSSMLQLKGFLDDLRRIASPAAWIFATGVAPAGEGATKSGVGWERVNSVAIRIWEHVSCMSGGSMDRRRREIFILPERIFLQSCREAGLWGVPMRIERTHGFAAPRNDYLLKPIKGEESRSTNGEPTNRQKDKHEATSSHSAS